MIHGLLKRVVHWSSQNSELDSSSGQFSQFQEQLTVCLDDLLQGDTMIAFWRLLEATIKYFLYP